MLRFHYLIQYFLLVSSEVRASIDAVVTRLPIHCHHTAVVLPLFRRPVRVRSAKGVNLDIVLKSCDMNIEQRYLKRDRNIETKLSHNCLPVFSVGCLWVVAHTPLIVIAHSTSYPISCCHCFNFFFLLLIKIIEWHEIRKVFNSAPPEYIADLLSCNAIAMYSFAWNSLCLHPYERQTEIKQPKFYMCIVFPSLVYLPNKTARSEAWRSKTEWFYLILFSFFFCIAFGFA